MHIKRMGRRASYKQITSLTDAITSLRDMGFTKPVAYLQRVSEEAVTFLYRAHTNQPAFSRPPLNRPLTPRVIHLFFTDLFAPYCVPDSVITHANIRVRQFPSTNRYHQEIIMKFYLRKKHHEEAREALHNTLGGKIQIHSFEYYTE